MSDWRWTDELGVQRLVGTEELRAALANSVLPLSTLVWREGMKEWAPASTVPELSSTTAASAASREGHAKAASDVGRPQRSRPSVPPPRRPHATLVGVSPPEEVQKSLPPSLPIIVPSAAAPAETGRGSITQIPRYGSPDVEITGISPEIPKAPRLPAPSLTRERPRHRRLSTSDIDGFWSAPLPEEDRAEASLPEEPAAAGELADTQAEEARAALDEKKPAVAFGEKAVGEHAVAPLAPKEEEPPAPGAAGAEPGKVGAPPPAIEAPSEQASADALLEAALEPAALDRLNAVPPPAEVAALARPIAAPPPLLASPPGAEGAAPKRPADKEVASSRPADLSPMRSRPPPPPPQRVRPSKLPPPPQPPQRGRPAGGAGSEGLSPVKLAHLPPPPPLPRESTFPPRLTAREAPLASPQGTAPIPGSAEDSAVLRAPSGAERVAQRPGSPPAPSPRLSSPPPRGEEASALASSGGISARPESSLSRPSRPPPPPPRLSRPPPLHFDLPPAEQPAKTEPAEQPAKAAPAEQAAKAAPAEQHPAKVEPVEQLSKAEPAEQPAKAAPAAQPAKTEPVEQRAKTEPAEQPAKADAAEVAKLPAASATAAAAPVAARAAEVPGTRGPRGRTVTVPVSSLLGASGAFLGVAIAAFFAGRLSAQEGPAVARPSLYAVPALARAAVPPPPKPCWVARQAVMWAPRASKSIPFDIVATAQGSLAIGYARDDDEAAGIEVSPSSGEVQPRFSKKLGGGIERVVPTPSADFQVMTSETTGALSAPVPVPAASPFFIGVQGGSLATADRLDGEPTALWPVESSEGIAAARVQITHEQGYGLTFRRDGAIWSGWLGADRKPATALTKVAGSGGAVGRPNSGWNRREFAVIFADRPEGSDRWEIRVGHAPAGTVPATTAVIPLPRGGPGGDAFAPDIAGLPDGRWLLIWTEGSSGSRAIRAQTFAHDFTPIGDPIALSPPAGNFGQGVLGVVEDYAGAVFLSKGASSYELWGAVLQCG